MWIFSSLVLRGFLLTGCHFASPRTRLVRRDVAIVTATIVVAATVTRQRRSGFHKIRHAERQHQQQIPATPTRAPWGRARIGAAKPDARGRRADSSADRAARIAKLTLEPRTRACLGTFIETSPPRGRPADRRVVRLESDPGPKHARRGRPSCGKLVARL
ncbi:hypothetical protein LC55x_0212 [Lysobacter capsici]|nr:hypothetical protein LC55x_0212 [Lysobacter capsici]